MKKILIALVIIVIIVGAVYLINPGIFQQPTDTGDTKQPEVVVETDDVVTDTTVETDETEKATDTVQDLCFDTETMMSELATAKDTGTYSDNLVFCLMNRLQPNIMITNLETKSNFDALKPATMSVEYSKIYALYNSENYECMELVKNKKYIEDAFALGKGDSTALRTTLEDGDEQAFQSLAKELTGRNGWSTYFDIEVEWKQNAVNPNEMAFCIQNVVDRTTGESMNPDEFVEALEDMGYEADMPASQVNSAKIVNGELVVDAVMAPAVEEVAQPTDETAPETGDMVQPTEEDGTTEEVVETPAETTETPTMDTETPAPEDTAETGTLEGGQISY